MFKNDDARPGDVSRRQRAAAYRAAERANLNVDPVIRTDPTADARAFEREFAPVRVRNVDPIVRPFDRVREHPVRQTIRLYGGRRVDLGEIYAR